MDPFFSIIIPVYNASQFLNTCINSIFKNDFDDYEIILVDDGSTDSSWEIIELFKSESVKIKAYKKKNSGVSDTRNYGLSKANGKYIYFVDADDWIDNKTLSCLNNQLIYDEYDYLIFNYKKVLNDMNIVCEDKIFDDERIIKGDDMKALGEKCLISGKMNNIGNKVYRTKVIRDNKLKFDSNLKRGEDWVFNLDFISSSSSAKYINRYYYNYRYNSESATSKFNLNDLDEFKKLSKVLNKYIGVFDLNENEVKSLLDIEFANRYLDVIKKALRARDIDNKNRKRNIIFLLDDNEAKEIFDKIDSKRLSVINRIMLYYSKNKNYNALIFFHNVIFNKLTNSMKIIIRRIGNN